MLPHLVERYNAAWHAASRSAELADQIQETVVMLGDALYHDCPEVIQMSISPEASYRSRQTAVTVYNFRSTRDTSTTWVHLALLMHHVETRQRCAAPVCIFTRMEGSLQRCAGCRRVPYCSRICQKRAWTHASLPHRSLRALLREVCAHSEIPEYDVIQKDWSSGWVFTLP
jgi:hypothetical protein